MTIENAIKYGQESLDTDIHYVKSGTGFFESHSDFVKTSLEALELQVPKKPWVKFYHERLRAACQNCDSYLDDHTNYCQNCGQKLDWT